MQSFTPVLFKYGSLGVDVGDLWAVVTNWLFVAGLVLFGARILLWQVLLRWFPLSLLHPFQSLTLVFVLALGSLLFDEHVTWGNVAGTLLIIFAVAVLPRSREVSPADRDNVRR